ncbi:MAG: corrinoid protein [Syntrophobacterales bacterium]|nr:MAG: corrinoid protein [Syntrophobacterales bacterium]
MTKEEIFERLSFSIVKADKEMAQEAAQEIIKQKIDPIEAIEKGLSKGMDIIGERFSKMEAFLPELMMAAQTFDTAMEILEPEIAAQKKEVTTRGTIVMGTVKGDVHNIGKNIVTMMLKIGGFDVHDLGVDVSPLSFVEAAQKNHADIIALSSLMTTTMPGQREVIEVLKEMGLRDQYCVIVGGGPVNQQWADQIGAEGYGETAADAVLLARDLLAERKK